MQATEEGGAWEDGDRDAPAEPEPGVSWAGAVLYFLLCHADDTNLISISMREFLTTLFYLMFESPN